MYEPPEVIVKMQISDSVGGGGGQAWDSAFLAFSQGDANGLWVTLEEQEFVFF